MFFAFFFNDTATTEIYTLSLHDALPISGAPESDGLPSGLLPYLTAGLGFAGLVWASKRSEETRLNSSHSSISYAVFCLKKKTLTIEVDKIKLHTKFTRQLSLLQDYGLQI